MKSSRVTVSISICSNFAGANPQPHSGDVVKYLVGKKGFVDFAATLNHTADAPA